MTDLPTQGVVPAARAPIQSMSLIIRSSVITAGLLAVLVFWPIALISRYREIQASTLDFQLRPEDPAIVLCGVLWIAIVATLIGSFRPLRIVPGLAELQTSFRRVCADSYFGLGHYSGWTYTSPDATLDLLEAPDLASFPEMADGSHAERQGAAAQAAPAVVHAVAAQPAEPIKTKPYVVQRRESWWAIAESVTGEAKHWSLIRDLNLGREVAPGLVIGPDTPLRSGWQIIVPADSSAL